VRETHDVDVAVLWRHDDVSYDVSAAGCCCCCCDVQSVLSDVQSASTQHLRHCDVICSSHTHTPTRRRQFTPSFHYSVTTQHDTTRLVGDISSLATSLTCWQCIHVVRYFVSQQWRGSVYFTRQRLQSGIRVRVTRFIGGKFILISGAYPEIWLRGREVVGVSSPPLIP